MRIDVICEDCRTRLKIAPKFAGRTIECPKCKQPVHVPMQFEEAAPEFEEAAPEFEEAAPEKDEETPTLDRAETELEPPFTPEAPVIEPGVPSPPSQQRPVRYHENVRLMLRILEFFAYFALAGVILIAVYIGQNIDTFTAVLVGAGGTVVLLPYIIIFRILEMVADIEVNTRITGNAVSDLARMMHESQDG